MTPTKEELDQFVAHLRTLKPKEAVMAARKAIQSSKDMEKALFYHNGFVWWMRDADKAITKYCGDN